MEALLDMLDAATAHCRRELGHVPDAAVAWQPFARGHNISALLLHLADTESLAIDEVVFGTPRSSATLEMFGVEFFLARPGDWPRPLSASLEWHYTIQDAIRSNTREKLASMNPEDAVNHPKWGTLTLAEVVLRLIHHEAYHTGQMMLHKIHYGWGGVEPALAA